ncbi:MAG: O-antigen ligase family protein [Ruminococcus sp.]
MMKNKVDLKQFEWAVFVIVMVVLFFSTQTYFGTANYSRIYRIDRYCILFFLGMSICANHGLIRYRNKDLLAFKIVLFPCIYQFTISFFYYATNHKISFSGLMEANTQAILVCLMAIVAYNSFGRKALRGVLIAAILNYFVYVITCIIQYGPLALFQAGTDTKASRLLEVHEVTFVFGILIVYLLISNFFVKKTIKKRWITLLVIFCLLGFKRILLVAMLLGLIIYFCLQKRKKSTSILVMAVLAIVVSLVWVFLCSSWDLLTGLSIKFGIDLAGRNWIYSNFYPYYEFSLSYVGAGVGYVQEMIYSMTTMVLGGHSIGLHNEYMRLFIELGYVPYIIYFAIVWPISIKILQHKIGYKTALEYFVLWIVTAICIATDNLLTYPNFMMSFWLILIIVISETQEDSKT